MRGYIENKGIPAAIYTDRHSTFRVNAKEASSAKTQLGRVFEDLSIGHICARSPQAKGRIERVFGTLQDRLVKELRLAQISTLDEANHFLKAYLPKHNQRFSRPAKNSSDAHHSIPAKLKLNRVFTIQSHRRISKNLEVHYEGETYQILEPQNAYRLANKKVLVCQDQDGQVTLYHGGRALKMRRFDDGDLRAPVLDSKELGPYVDQFLARRSEQPPRRHHPWRSGRA